MSNRNRSTPDGRGLGIAFVVLGVLATGIAYIVLQINGAVPRLFVAGPALLTLGVAMIILPGSREVSATDQKRWLRDSPWSHKLVWIASALAGLALAFRYLLGWV